MQVCFERPPTPVRQGQCQGTLHKHNMLMCLALQCLPVETQWHLPLCNVHVHQNIPYSIGHPDEETPVTAVPASQHTPWMTPNDCKLLVQSSVAAPHPTLNLYTAVKVLLPCAGPDAFTRRLAGRQLAFLLRQLDYRHLSGLLPSALPYVLDIVKDPSPSVQCYGLHALHHIATGIISLTCGAHALCHDVHACIALPNIQSSRECFLLSDMPRVPGGLPQVARGIQPCGECCVE